MHAVKSFIVIYKSVRDLKAAFQIFLFITTIAIPPIPTAIKIPRGGG